MISSIKKAMALYFIIAISFVFISPTHGYVLQGPHVLDLMIENLGVTESLFVSQKLIYFRAGSAVDSQQLPTAYDPQQPVDTADTQGGSPSVQDRNADVMETLELEESLRFVFLQAFRSDARSFDSERIHIFNNGKTLTVIDGIIVPVAESRFDLYKDLLLYRSRETLIDRLSLLGVDVSISSLGRFEEKIAFILGAEYPDESVSQVWIDKDTFLPIRWIIKSVNPATESDTMEIRYLIWWKIGKTRYPSRIEFYQDGNLVRVNLAINFEESAPFSEKLFNIEHLKTIYPRAPEQLIVPGEPEESSEVQKTIEEFKRIFE